MVGSQVTDGGGHVEGDLVLSVDWHAIGHAVTHASMLKYVPSILALVHEKAIGALLHRDVKEVVQEAKVRHGKLLLKSHSGMLKKLRVQGSEEDVIDIEEQVCDIDVAMVDKHRSAQLGLYVA
jgi:hypothetical protein